MEEWARDKDGTETSHFERGLEEMEEWVGLEDSKLRGWVSRSA